MGAFVLGVLVGWLAEWLFYTYWVKAGDDGDCSAIKEELELKNRQISSLQAQLASFSGDKPNSTAKLASSSTTKKTTNKTAVSGSPKSPTNNKSKPSAKTAGARSNKSSAKGSTKTTKAKTVSTSKTQKAPNKGTGSPSTKRKVKPGGDDFTKLSGIGPSMSATLKTLGIDTFEKLASTDDDILRDMLENSDVRMNNNKDAMDSWNEQATVAAKGDFKALKAMQLSLKK